MRLRAYLPLAIGVTALALPLAAAHAGGIPFFGPIIEKSWGQCALSWGALIMVINNIISLLITLVIVFVAPIMIGYAGFLFVINPVNASGISEAKRMLWNVVLGLVLSLSGYLIVNAVMAVLYHPSGTVADQWSHLITGNSNDICLQQRGTSVAPTSGVNPPGQEVPLALGTGVCDARAILASAPNLTINEANTFACLAGPESGCGNPAKDKNYSWNIGNKDGLASTAFGAFQVTLSGNHACFENQTCYTAAGVSGPLNCHLGFDPKGFTAGGNPTILANCLKAAANQSCNIVAAVCVYKKQGFGAWTVDPKGAVAQKQCVAKYANP